MWKGGNKGGTPLMILTQPFGAYYPNIQVGVGKYAHTQCCYCAQSELVTWPHYPIRTVGFFNSSFLENINPTFKWDWANKPKLIVVVVPRSSNQTWRVFYLTSWVNLLKVGLIWFRIYTCWNIFLSYGPILNSLYLNQQNIGELFFSFPFTLIWSQPRWV